LKTPLRGIKLVSQGELCSKKGEDEGDQARKQPLPFYGSGCFFSSLEERLPKSSVQKESQARKQQVLFPGL
jgi:hypothetical protein